MFILGTNSDDTGAQLEQLTRAILANRQYQNLALNIAGSGGQEIDVTGEVVSSVPGNNQRRRLICECKAYRSPIGMTDWLKFLGKLYSEQRRLQMEVDGLFVALCGANGNVLGNYDELRRHNAPVTLMEGEQLLDEVYRVYPNVVRREAVLTGLERMTARRHLSIDLAYREGQFFWIIVFPESRFTVCSGDGNALAEDQAPDIVALIRERISVTDFMPLSEEARRLQARNRLEKLFITRLAEQNGSIERVELNRDTGENDDVVAEALLSLEGHPWITAGEGILRIGSHECSDSECFGRATLHLMTGRVPGDLARRFFSTDYFERNLNDDLFRHIGTIQGGLPVVGELLELLRRVLILSPSACVQCLVPQALIVNHRTNQPDVNANMDDHDRSILRRIVLQAVASDFEQRGLYEYLYEVRGLREIDTRQSVTIKTATEAILTSDVRIRHGIGAADDSIGGGYIGILILDHAPEPWEEGGIGYTVPPNQQVGANNS